MRETGAITLYDLVVSDAASGRRYVVTDKPPLSGRYQAETELRRMERNNRNPNLRYSLERSQRKPQAQADWCPEALLTHKFRAR